MSTAIAWVAAFFLAGFLFPVSWSRVAPAVYKITKSHAAQLAAMLAVFLMLFVFFGSVFSVTARELLG